MYDVREWEEVIRFYGSYSMGKDSEACQNFSCELQSLEYLSLTLIPSEGGKVKQEINLYYIG